MSHNDKSNLSIRLKDPITKAAVIITDDEKGIKKFYKIGDSYLTPLTNDNSSLLEQRYQVIIKKLSDRLQNIHYLLVLGKMIIDEPVDLSNPVYQAWLRVRQSANRIRKKTNFFTTHLFVDEIMDEKYKRRKKKKKNLDRRRMTDGLIIM